MSDEACILRAKGSLPECPGVCRRGRAPTDADVKSGDARKVILAVADRRRSDLVLLAPVLGGALLAFSWAERRRRCSEIGYD